MPDQPHFPHRARSGTPGVRASSREAVGSTPACVIAGLLRGQPELALLQKAAARVARIELVDDRLALVSTVLATRPGALVLPPFDSERTSTAPLVLRVRREAPGVAILVVASHPSGAGQPMLRAVQAGAQVIAAANADELHEALVGALASGSEGA